MSATHFAIPAISAHLKQALTEKIDNKTKPLGALGKLEGIALRIGQIQNTLDPVLREPSLLVFAGDHGCTQSGVSAYPSAVTQQMVYNFLSGGAAINVFCRQNGLHLAVVDAGVNHNFADVPGLVHAKIGFGTKNFIKEPAMTRAQCDQALQKGADLVARLPEKNNCNVVGFGEMGIGNTSSAACIMSLLCDLPIDTCVGRGTGVDDAGLQRKRDLLAAAIAKFTGPKDAVSVLIYFGGFEIAMMCGAMLKAASLRMIVLVDGFVASAACLAAAKMAPAMLNYCFFAHRSHERGHTLMLDHLNAEPILDLQMRLGEGTGAALAYPILKAATCFLNEMASFDSAKVSQTTAEK